MMDIETKKQMQEEIFNELKGMDYALGLLKDIRQKELGGLSGQDAVAVDQEIERTKTVYNKQKQAFVEIYCDA